MNLWWGQIVFYFPILKLKCLESKKPIIIDGLRNMKIGTFKRMTSHLLKHQSLLSSLSKTVFSQLIVFVYQNPITNKLVWK
jgi:hypothetical protein